jgi:hypothetical protein
MTTEEILSQNGPFTGEQTAKIEQYLGTYGYTLVDLPDGVLSVALDVLLNGMDGTRAEQRAWERGVLDLLLNLAGAQGE